MMRFLTAAAAVSLLAAGAAYAQDSTGGMTPAAGQTAQPGADGSTMPQQAPASGGAMSDGSTMPQQAPASGGAMSDGSMGGAGAMAPSQSMGAAESADTPSAAPGEYPPCTSRGQDRCTQGGRMGSEHMTSKHAMKHHRMMHHHAKAKTSKMTTAEPAATPQ